MSVFSRGSLDTKPGSLDASVLQRSNLDVPVSAAAGGISGESGGGGGGGAGGSNVNAALPVPGGNKQM